MDERAFSMRALTGGMTNAVFRCSKLGGIDGAGENDTVLLRSYGGGSEVSERRALLCRCPKISYGPIALRAGMRWAPARVAAGRGTRGVPIYSVDEMSTANVRRGRE